MEIIDVSYDKSTERGLILFEGEAPNQKEILALILKHFSFLKEKKIIIESVTDAYNNNRGFSDHGVVVFYNQLKD